MDSTEAYAAAASRAARSRRRQSTVASTSAPAFNSIRTEPGLSCSAASGSAMGCRLTSAPAASSTFNGLVPW